MDIDHQSHVSNIDAIRAQLNSITAASSRAPVRRQRGCPQIAANATATHDPPARQLTKRSASYYKLAKKPSVELAQRIWPNYLGMMDVVCKHCQALHWDAEKLASSTKDNVKFGSLCCCDGNTSIPKSKEPPSFLRAL